MILSVAMASAMAMRTWLKKWYPFFLFPFFLFEINLMNKKIAKTTTETINGEMVSKSINKVAARPIIHPSRWCTPKTPKCALKKNQNKEKVTTWPRPSPGVKFREQPVAL